MTDILRRTGKMIPYVLVRTKNSAIPELENGTENSWRGRENILLYDVYGVSSIRVDSDRTFDS